MAATRSLALPLAALLVALLAALLVPAAAAPRVRRQLADDAALQPLDSGITWRRPVGTHNRHGRSRRATAQDDDIPTFDRNKVSLDFPGSLFGPSVSLLIRTTKIVGDVIQNSAVRYQSFLRLFRPLFRGPFEIKGLDPPPPTTTTTTSTTAAPPAITSPATMPEVPDIPGDQPADNEVRRRRRHFQQ